jgi:lysophospholipase L1-like esterase
MPSPFADNFNRADAPTLGSCPVTPGGTPQPWVQQSGNIGIASNQAVATSASGLATLDCGGPNGDLQFTIAALGTGAPRPMFRGTDANNYLMIQASGGVYYLFQVAGGSPGHYDVIPGTPANGDVIKVSLYNQYISIYINGSLALNSINNLYTTGTLVGFAWTGGAGAKFDNFSFAPTDPAAVRSLLVCEGDSISVAPDSGGPQSYPQRLLVALGASRWDMTNVATPGDTVQAMIGEASGQVDVLYDATRPKNVACFFGGTNDLYFGTSESTLQTYYSYWCTQRRSLGFTVVAFTILPRSNAGTPATFEADRQAFNAWLRANYHSFADKLADVAADPRIGSPGAEQNTTYFADLVHPTAAGAQVIADVVTGVLATFNPAWATRPALLGSGVY